MGIFEANNSEYSIRWEGIPGAWRNRSIPEIFDSNLQLVGKLDLTGKLFKKLLMLDTSDSIILIAAKKLWTRTYVIKDERENLFGMVKLHGIFKREKMSFYDLDKNELLKARSIGEKKGNYFSGIDIKDFEIYPPDGKKVVTVSNNEGTWKISILDTTFDRKKIFSLIMAIFSSAYDDMPGGEGAG